MRAQKIINKEPKPDNKNKKFRAKKKMLISEDQKMTLIKNRHAFCK